MVLSRPDILTYLKEGGTITLEMANFGKVPVELRAEVDEPAQLILMRLSTPLPAEDVYGTGTGDVFQYQSDPIPR